MNGNGGNSEQRLVGGVTVVCMNKRMNKTYVYPRVSETILQNVLLLLVLYYMYNIIDN